MHGHGGRQGARAGPRPLGPLAWATGAARGCAGEVGNQPRDRAPPRLLCTALGPSPGDPSFLAWPLAPLWPCIYITIYKYVFFSTRMYIEDVLWDDCSANACFLMCVCLLNILCLRLAIVLLFVAARNSEQYPRQLIKNVYLLGQWSILEEWEAEGRLGVGGWRREAPQWQGSSIHCMNICETRWGDYWKFQHLLIRVCS